MAQTKNTQQSMSDAPTRSVGVQRLVSACGICQNERRRPEELRHLPIYVNGSEGIYVCPDCDNALSNHVSAMRSAANRAKLQAMINAHIER